MSNYEAGNVYTGKVTGIKPFGAFVALDEEKRREKMRKKRKNIRKKNKKKKIKKKEVK